MNIELSRFHRCLLQFLFAAIFLSPNACAQRVAPREDYDRIAAEVTAAIEYEIEDKNLSAISIAIIDDQEIVWADGFGNADPDSGRAATADTIYRVGSVSKLFTDIGVMQLVERGDLDLDAPIEEYLPEFQPKNPFDTSITLRQLMSHRAGLVREPPIGNYFDDSGVSLSDTVASLYGTELVLEPESKSKYSNAGIAVVGYVLEKLSGKPFAKYLKSAVLDPMGLRQSAFEPSDAINKHLAVGQMWSYDGRTYDAPPIQLGMAPAGSMYSSVKELCQFMRVVFNNGAGPEGQVLQSDTLKTMLTPQFGPEDAKTGFGIGFLMSQLDDEIACGHGGAIYGFSTQLQFIPSQKIGVVVVSATDVTNTITRRLATHTLRSVLAARRDQPLPEYATSKPIDPMLARALDGVYRSSDQRRLELVERNGNVFAFYGLERVRLRQQGDRLMMDGRLGFGPAVEVLSRSALRIGDEVYRKQSNSKPPVVQDRWKGLVGEYGWDHNVLFVFERDEKLHLLIEWVEIDALDEVAGDRFAFSKDSGMYHDEFVEFRRDEDGKATEAIVAGIRFKRRHLIGEEGKTFSIRPVRPIDELRAEALAAEPPEERGGFRDSDLVDLAALDASIKFDIRYASTNNFVQSEMYTTAKAFMQRPAAEALVRAHHALKDHGYGLLIHDAYRPWHVTKMFWDATPQSSKHFVANPSLGSRHNRGCAVDLTLYDLKSGEPVQTVGQYDEFSERSYPNYIGGTSRQRWHRELLRDAMEAAGFTVYEYEWWHFDYGDWRHYRIENRTFEEILSLAENESH